MKEIEEELNEKLSFLGGFAAAFRDQIHTDIEVKPGHNGPSLFAHRALLVSLFSTGPLFSLSLSLSLSS